MKSAIENPESASFISSFKKGRNSAYLIYVQININPLDKANQTLINGRGVAIHPSRPSAHTGAAATINPFSNLPKRKPPSDKFKVEFNNADQMLLSDMKVEVPSTTLSKIRIELHGSDQGQEIGPAEALCAEIPRRALEHFHGYLKSGLASNEEASWSFQNIITFLRGEIRMRLYNCSALELCDFGFSTNDSTRFERVRKALTKADRPASERDDSMPAYSFDPLITPTKDKKLKPVNHLQATTAGGYITMMIPDTLNLQMKDMLKESIDHLVPPGPGSEAVRSALVFSLIVGTSRLPSTKTVRLRT